MKKIFKYNYNAATGEVCMPEDAYILRVDAVYDKFYQGEFLWAIVDTEDEKVNRKLSLPLGYTSSEFKDSSSNQFTESGILKIKEKQTFWGHKPAFVCAEDGIIYVYCQYDIKTKNIHRNIAFYKTGQEIDLPVEKLRYLGVAKLTIVQELALYAFCVEE